ncbi:MAG TPA: DNA gyrase subunit A [Jatrophihabitans sp.]|jgi:DNA gyrase subunit A
MDETERRAYGEERLHILDALVAVLGRRNEFIELVTQSSSDEDAVARLRSEWGLSQVQAIAVLDLQIRRFAGLNRERIEDERRELMRLLQEG